MLTSCFGLPLRTGTNAIAIVNSIAWICYVLYYVWEYSSNYGYTTGKPFTDLNESFEKSSMILDEVFLNYITLVFMLVGFTSMFASFGLKQAIIKNATHKIYLWLLIGYVQIGAVVTIEIVVLTKHANAVKDVVGFIICFTFVNAILAFQLLVVQSFYAEEKLVEESNYQRLRSELSSQIQQPDDEFENVEL